MLENRRHRVIATLTAPAYRRAGFGKPARYRTVTLACVLGALISCGNVGSPYLAGDRNVRNELSSLFEAVSESTSQEHRFVANQRIMALYRQAGRVIEEVLYLTSYVESFPDDQFNAYYLLLVAEYYKAEGAFPFALHYYERIVKNHLDLLLDERHSVHKICLTNLIELVTEPEIRVGYYKEILSRFADEIDRGRMAFELAETYEQLGEWELAMQFYKEYLNYPESPIPGRLNAREEVRQLVTLYHMPNKNWMFEELEDLIAGIQRAIWARNPRYLNDLRSKVGFFAKAWEDDETTATGTIFSDLGDYLKGPIHVPGILDHDSNDREAYLMTNGWGFRIPKWYLYFRRLDFPADPAIHGQWEWAGIYLGEKPY